MSKQNFKMAIAAAAAAGLLIATPVFADPATGPRPGMGPGMMGGTGPGYGRVSGMTAGGEQECDKGPGMAGGYGQGYGHGPGMMGGYGHGYGVGPGMMGYGGAPGLSLSDEQRAKAIKIHDATRKKMWESMGSMFDASSTLRELLSASTRDRAAISAAYKQVAALRQKMFELGLDAQEEFAQILSADQRKHMQR